MFGTGAACMMSDETYECYEWVYLIRKDGKKEKAFICLGIYEDKECLETVATASVVTNKDGKIVSVRFSN